MNQKAYKALEYYKIINMLTDKASSSMGKEICRKLEPSTDIDEIRNLPDRRFFQSWSWPDARLCDR